MMQQPKLKLKIELSVPREDGGPSKKYSISRSLKARWSDSSRDTSSQILEEIKTYKGSFVGDMISGLLSLVNLNDALLEEKNSRRVDVERWATSIIDSLVFSGIKDDLHKLSLESQEICEWDGSTKTLDDISSEELENVDIDNVMMLLTPKVKHALFLISKDIQKLNKKQ